MRGGPRRSSASSSSSTMVAMARVTVTRIEALPLSQGRERKGGNGPHPRFAGVPRSAFPPLPPVPPSCLDPAPPTPKAEPPLLRSVSPLTKKGGTGGNGRPDWRLPGRFAFPLWGNGGRNEGERPVGQFADRPPFAPAPPARGRDTAADLALYSGGAGRCPATVTWIRPVRSEERRVGQECVSTCEAG